MEDVLARITEALAKLSETHGEGAVRTVLETASLMALHEILLTFVGLAFGLVLLWVGKRMKIAQWGDGRVDMFDNPFVLIGKYMSYTVGVIFVLINVSTMLNPILWKSVSDPKYYITYQILKKAK